MSKNKKLKTVLLLASLMTVMSGAVIAPALTEMAEFFKGSASVLVKLIITIPALIIAVFGSVLGNFSSRIGKKNLLIVSLIIYGLSGFSGYFIDNLNLLLLSRAILGIGVAGIMIMATILVGDYFEGSERNSFMGTQSAFMSLGGVLFLLSGGVLADINWRLPFTLYLVSFLVLPLVIWILYEPITKKEVIETKGKKKGATKQITLIYFFGFVGMIFFYMIPTQIPFLLKERLDVDSILIGVAIAISTLTGAISSMNYGRIKKKFDYSFIFVLVFMLMSYGYFIIAFNTSYVCVLIGLAVSGLGVGLLFPNCNLWLMELVEVSKRGKTIGGMTSLIFFGQFISPLVVAIFIAKFSLTNSFFTASGLMLVLSFTPFITKKRTMK